MIGANRRMTSWMVAAVAALLLAAVGPSAVSSTRAHPARSTERAVPPASSVRTVFLTPVSERASWRDDLFLTVVPAAAAVSGKPLVCAVQPDSPWRPELLDYLRRYKPERVVWVGSAPTDRAPDGLPVEVMDAGTPADAACTLATAFWRKTSRAVAYNPDDRAGALAASVLAARLRIPLFPCPDGVLPGNVGKCLARLGVSRLMAVGDVKIAPSDGRRFQAERLPDPLAVAACLARERLKVDYLAVTHPHDGADHGAPRVSLAAVLLAAGREGAVVPLPFEPVWKRRFPTGAPLAEAPAGAHASKSGHRTGVIEFGGVVRTFVVGQDAETEHWWAQFDLDGNGRFDGAGEGPLRTGEVVRLGDTRYVVDLDAVENERGRAVWLTSPTPADVVECLARYRTAIGRDPRYLCIAGWPEAVPLAITGDAQGTDADLVTDHPYAQTDEDPFVDMAFARFIAEDVASATLQACRGLTLDDIRDRALAETYATAEWAEREGNPLELAGLRHMGHHDGRAPITADSPLTRVGAILHDSHAMWTVLGGTYTWNSDVLLSPCIVESGGCSTASLDQDARHRSVAARMLRNGAVAFVGNGRRGIAQSALYRSEVWNALLDGKTLGEANRAALNRSMVAILEKGEPRGGSYRYEQDHVAAYGDPALALRLPRGSGAVSARVVVRGSRVEVVAPREWKRTGSAPLPEWKCRYPKLWTWNALGVGTESAWRGGDNYDVDDLLMTVEIRSRSRIVGVEPLDKPAPPLGWTGKCYVDEHSDGTRSLYFRCRLIDFGMTTGQVRKQIGKLGFRLQTK